MQTKTNAIQRLPGNATVLPSGYYNTEGYLVQPDMSFPANATAVPFGVITDAGDEKQVDIAILGGASGIYHVRLSGSPGTVARGTVLVSAGDGTAKADPGTGARVQVAIATESGAANELIEAVLIAPEKFAS